jgi:hypothetical protein
VHSGGLTYVIDSSGDALKQLELSEIGVDKPIVLQTGRISCGNFAMEKTFKTLHITVKNPGADFQVDFANGNGAFGGAVQVASGSTDGTYSIAIPSAYKTGKDISIKISDSNPPVGFEISDMQLIYKDKRVK